MIESLIPSKAIQSSSKCQLTAGEEVLWHFTDANLVFLCFERHDVTFLLKTRYKLCMFFIFMKAQVLTDSSRRTSSSFGGADILFLLGMCNFLTTKYSLEASE